MHVARSEHSTSGSRLRCTPARRLHSVTRASRRSSSARASAAERVRASRRPQPPPPPPPPPPRCAAPLRARIVAGSRTHTARRLRHLPILSASAPLHHPGAATSIAPGRWRRPLCMRAPRFLCARNGPTNLEVRAAPGSADGSHGRRQTHWHTRQVGTSSAGRCGEGVERERRGSVILV